MKQLIGVLLAMMMVTSVFADGDASEMLDKVSLQLKADKWMTTTTAQVNVSVNAGVADAGIERVQSQVLSKLAELSNAGEWHVVSFSRQEDKSGLESVQINAEARLPQSSLVSLRGKAKSLSKPGETYTIDNIQFTPSDEEREAANIAMRSMIYSQAKAEIERLNKLYPEQKFYLYRVDFTVSPVAMPMMAMRTEAKAHPLNVGGKVEMLANVTLASMPEVKKSPLINP